MKEMIARFAVDTQYAFQLIDTDGDGSVSGSWGEGGEAKRLPTVETSTRPYGSQTVWEMNAFWGVFCGVQSVLGRLERRFGS